MDKVELRAGTPSHYLKFSQNTTNLDFYYDKDLVTLPLSKLGISKISKFSSLPIFGNFLLTVRQSLGATALILRPKLFVSTLNRFYLETPVKIKKSESDKFI